MRLDTGSSDEDGQLVFLNDRLVAVLVRLSDQHGAEAGRWFLEHSFGPVGRSKRPTFPDLETATRWITEHYAAP